MAKAAQNVKAQKLKAKSRPKGLTLLELLTSDDPEIDEIIVPRMNEDGDLIDDEGNVIDPPDGDDDDTDSQKYKVENIPKKGDPSYMSWDDYADFWIKTNKMGQRWMPIYTRNPKGKTKTLSSFDVPRTIWDTMENLICDKANDFTSYSGIARAALCVMVPIFARVNLDKTKFKMVHEALRIFHKQMELLGVFDLAIESFGKIYDLFLTGFIPEAELAKGEKKILESVPEEMKGMVKENFLRIKSGQSVGSIKKLVYQGGNRGD